MNPVTPFGALLRLEFLLRSRRRSTLVVMLGVLLVSWLMVGNPADGIALVVVDSQRLRYSSETLAFGSAHFGNLLLSLAGFYLARGRVQEDLRCGMAGVLAAAPVGNRRLLLARALGAWLYLLALAGVQLLSTWVLHAVRGEGPWLPWVYLLHYGLLMGPGLLLAAGFATLCDAWAPLLGRRGDVAYFFCWILLLALLPLNEHARGLNPSLLLDINGLATTANRLIELVGTRELGIGMGEFDPALPLRDFPPGLWSAELVLLRLGSALIALLPLALALPLFHRYAPDRVRVRAAGAGRLARVLRGVLWPLRPLQRRLAAALPRLAQLPFGRGLLAELLLTLVSEPLALAWLLLGWLGPLAAEPQQLWGWQAALLAGWALWAAELGSRELGPLQASLPGGALQRLLQRWGATLLLGLLGSATLMARQPASLPMLACGLALASALALLLGQLARSGRGFLGLFLFWVYLATQARDLPWLDWMGFNAVAGPAVALSAGLGSLGLLGLSVWLQRRH